MEKECGRCEVERDYSQPQLQFERWLIRWFWRPLMIAAAVTVVGIGILSMAVLVFSLT